MTSGLLRRRSLTAISMYAAVAIGILGTIVAARIFSLEQFGVYATALAAVGFLQVLVDLTVEESLTKYGFRYVTARDWGRLRRLFRQMLFLKLAGGAAAALALVLLAPFADNLFGTSGLETALLAGALLPLVQSAENIGSTAVLLHGRYDVRGAYQAGSSALRLVAIAIAAPMGVTETMAALVVAQSIATATISVVGLAALGRFPTASSRGLGEDVPDIRSFVIRSSLGTGVVSLRTTLVPLLLGVVAGSTQVGLFRIAQTPQAGFAAVSSPARLVLLTEQTRDWERGRYRQVLAGVRAYTLGASALMVVAVPVFFVAMPWLVEHVFGQRYLGAVDAARIILVAGAIQFALGWTKSLPVTVGRPHLRIVTHGLEALVALPLVIVLGSKWGATGAAAAALASTVVFAAAWIVAMLRLRSDVSARDPGAGATGPATP